MSELDTKTHAFLVKILNDLVASKDLSQDDTTKLMTLVMSGECPDVLLSAIATAWRIKGETVDEITASARVMRSFANKVTLSADNAVDIVGTGGDGANLFNVSTASAFVIAAGGGMVAKHGSTGVSSRSGASDLLTSAGVNLALNAEQVAQCADETGVCFMFAPNHHPAMRHAKAVRGALKIRTIFNILGPLTNPASAPNTLLGVYDVALCEKLAKAMGELGSRHVWVVHSDDGLDEISLTTPTTVCEYKDGQTRTFKISPDDVGIRMQSLDGLAVGSSNESFELIKHALQNQIHDERTQKAQHIIALNAGASLYLCGVADDFKSGVELALTTLQSGKAWDKLQAFAQFTQKFQQ
ncbi:MAG: anthranilate phosphoribosyltransferase [Moraxella sp.]|uniref:anthranilate phosphoribosyltransferase n=1 Tax=Moraxella sp. TaxID=479 RepID=UPI0026DB51E6|nr:anthranilate phosphoribosyltransferase [Moraxella sp.]MDO4451039.1 anthranilate phosphoribosyltransferase [Moraxella sp.]